MSEVWYAQFETATGVHLHELPPASRDAEHQQRSALLAELREEHGIPADWLDSPDREANGWQVSLVVFVAPITVHPLES
ncbi:hypothetical protein [Micromonospora fulviviridis]|uniref:hypothetical protein n=1 Tax=Micromonospora fulviviridis TaxID=47860 RepID=UPI00378B4C03